MDKNILKKFAIESRKDLIASMDKKIKSFYVNEEFNKTQKGELYVLSNGRYTLTLSKEEYDKRELLIKRINELGLDQVIEEAAYTWFNRIIAIRYMEINNYLPLTKDNQSLGIRVLSSKDNTPDPEIMKFSNLNNPELDISFNKDQYDKEEDPFNYILLLICKKLKRVIPQVFDDVTDYIDILIPDNLLNESGFVSKLVREVPEDNFNDVEIIGWLYQYYNQEEKDRVISAKKAYKKNEIPYATQIFTPDWIVKYMVENSLGRYYVEHNGLGLEKEWQYFIKDNINLKDERIDVKKIKFIDPCSGSGHILVYAFELFYQIYLQEGYNKKDIPELILKNNLYGLDIDDRAGQLSILSVILKAREYDKNIFNSEIIKNLNIMSIQESTNIDKFILDEIKDKETINYLMDTFKNAKEIGSLLLVEDHNYDEIINEINKVNNIFKESFNKLLSILKEAKILSSKYDVVVTNPPYMGNSMMSKNIKDYLVKYYNDSKTDLCTAFMEVNVLKDNGYLGMINQQAWMFLSSFEKLRKKLIDNKSIVSMVHLGSHSFEEVGGEVVQTTSFILLNGNTNNDSIFIRLVDFRTADKKREEFLNAICSSKNKFVKNTIDFKNIPGSSIAYWISNNFITAFESKKIDNYANVITGMTTGDNNKYLKLWYEININDINFEIKDYKQIDIKYKYWYPYSKGGNRRKWFGNYDCVVNWSKSGEFNRSKTTLKELYFKKAITWPFISSGEFSARILDEGFLWDVAGSPCFVNNKKYYNYILALLNTNLTDEILKLVNPTINVQAIDLLKVPVIIDENKIKEIDKIVEENISISKQDWDSFETSWDFTTHPLIEYKSGAGFDTDISKWNYKVKDAFECWEDNCENNFNQLKQNEEELNRIFIDIYGLQDELTPEVEDNDVTIRKADKVRDIKSLISYAVGCMFGRYSLDEEGLIYAGGEFDINKYKTFKVDQDNIIPITDDAYFSDDIVSKFKQFIEVVYGKDTLNENLDFIADTLGKKGTETSEETIRRYFLNDFYKDHVKMYQKKPIYWLFDSGKKNGFKALIYMHRYNENTVPKVRLDYLHRIQITYEKLLTDINYKLTTDLSLTDKKEVQKRQADLNNKLTEIKEYDERIAHIANQRINIDLDDGVTVNYAKFQDILAKIK